jgi:hypothetical protein
VAGVRAREGVGQFVPNCILDERPVVEVYVVDGQLDPARLAAVRKNRLARGTTPPIEAEGPALKAEAPHQLRCEVASLLVACGEHGQLLLMGLRPAGR